MVAKICRLLMSCLSGIFINIYIIYTAPTYFFKYFCGFEVKYSAQSLLIVLNTDKSNKVSPFDISCFVLRHHLHKMKLTKWNFDFGKLCFYWTHCACFLLDKVNPFLSHFVYLCCDCILVFFIFNSILFNAKNILYFLF